MIKAVYRNPGWSMLFRPLLQVFSLLILLSSQVTAGTLTVGTGGNFDSIQAALEFAAGNTGDDDIRVRDGTYFENIFIDFGGSGDRVVLSGGWNAGFTAQSGGRDSIIDGNASGQTMFVQLSGDDEFIMNGFVVRNGLAGFAAGLFIETRNSSFAEVFNNTITDNHAEDTRANEAGLSVALLDSSEVIIRDNSITENTTTSSDNVDVRGGGITMQLSGTSSGVISGNIISDNELIIGAGGSGLGAGLDITGFDPTASFTMTDNVVSGNRITASTVLGSGMILGGGDWVVRRNQFVNNTDVNGGTTSAQLLASVTNGSGLLSDSLIIMGGAQGARLSANNGGLIQISNLTIADHVDRGLFATLNGTGMMSVFNTISVNAGTNAQLDPGITTGNNLFMDDPGLFANPAMGDYQLAAGSAAVDAGTNSPPGGLGPTDLNGAVRVIGPSVDIGAYEAGDEFFIDGFEL